MKVKNSLIAALLLVLAVPSIAVARDKKIGQRGMLESMQSVPCGAKERGVNGLGSVFASVGVAHVNSHEQLCPQYLLRTDAMDYHIRPLDLKHPVVLPVGHEAEFRVKKDRLYLRMADGEKKELEYQVVSQQPANTENNVESTAYRPPQNDNNAQPPANSQPTNPGVAKATAPANNVAPPPPPPPQQ
ncbi:MAG: hypothetical protein ABSB87_07340 [Terriglobales bacterium]|jgi:hypothetical protein